jgi:hypothetical protein
MFNENIALVEILMKEYQNRLIQQEIADSKEW